MNIAIGIGCLVLAITTTAVHAVAAGVNAKESGQTGHYDFEFNANPSCTRGRLFVTEANSGTLRVYNQDDSNALIATFASARTGAINTYVLDTGRVVVLVNGGNAAQNYSDGQIRFFTSGLNGPAAAEAGVVQHS